MNTTFTRATFFQYFFSTVKDFVLFVKKTFFVQCNKINNCFKRKNFENKTVFSNFFYIFSRHSLHPQKQYIRKLLWCKTLEIKSTNGVFEQELSFFLWEKCWNNCRVFRFYTWFKRLWAYKNDKVLFSC